MLLFHSVNRRSLCGAWLRRTGQGSWSSLSWYSRRKVSTSLACLSILADRRLSPAATALTTPGSSESARRSALCTMDQPGVVHMAFRGNAMGSIFHKPLPGNAPSHAADRAQDACHLALAARGQGSVAAMLAA